TRDTVEETASLDGFPLTLVDTAGLREADDEVERLGVARARAAADGADALLVVLDRSQPMTSDARAILALADGRPAVVALNKADLPAALEAPSGRPALPTSATAGEGLSALRAALLAALGASSASAEGLLPANARHEAALAAATDDLTVASQSHHADARAAALAAAVDQLGSITGESASDDLLEAIFSRFCIGK
ncbi:MAG TPA: GTPase, partial [Chloroflexota bacterium]